MRWRWRLRRWARGFSYNWQLLHFAATPFGIFLTTIVVTHLRHPTVRPAVANFDGMASLVSISAAYYGMIAVVAELGGRTVFWALAQWQKEKDEAKRKRLRRNARDKAAQAAAQVAARAEGHAEGRSEGHSDIILAMWGAAQSDDERARIRRVAEERGIPLPTQGE